jgi:hypothetical protein
MSNTEMEKTLQRQLKDYIATFRLNNRMIDVLEWINHHNDVPDGAIGYDRRPTQTIHALEIRSLVIPEQHHYGDSTSSGYLPTLDGERVIKAFELLDLLERESYTFLEA